MQTKSVKEHYSTNTRVIYFLKCVIHNDNRISSTQRIDQKTRHRLCQLRLFHTSSPSYIEFISFGKLYFQWRVLYTSAEVEPICVSPNMAGVAVETLILLSPYFLSFLWRLNTSYMLAPFNSVMTTFYNLSTIVNNKSDVTFPWIIYCYVTRSYQNSNIGILLSFTNTSNARLLLTYHNIKQLNFDSFMCYFKRENNFV
jgi:hypothetical protein